MIEGLLTVAAVAVGTLAMNITFDWLTGYPGRVARWQARRIDG